MCLRVSPDSRCGETAPGLAQQPCSAGVGVLGLLQAGAPNADSERHPISTNGGTSPLWAPDGSELFYVNDGRLLAVPVQTAPTFSRGTAAVVIDGDYRLSAGPLRQYDIDPSGERFLVVKLMSAGGETGALPSLTFVLNWFEELKERVPVP